MSPPAPREGLQASLATAVPGVFLICISCVAPLTLFKLLAFVDPGTSSGAAMRAGLAAQGGVQALLAGGAGAGGAAAGSGAASSTDEHGRSVAETSGEGATTQRLAAAGGLLGGLSGAAGSVGSAAGTVLGAMTALGGQGAVIGADVTNQAGIGHNTYVPDVPHRRGPTGSGDGPVGGDGGEDGDGPGVGGDDHPAVHGIAAHPPAVPTARPPTVPSGAGGAAGAGGQPVGERAPSR